MDEKVKTSIKFNKKLWMEVKIKAIRLGIDVSKYLEQLVKKDLQKVKK